MPGVVTVTRGGGGVGERKGEGAKEKGRRRGVIFVFFRITCVGLVFMPGVGVGKEGGRGRGDFTDGGDGEPVGEAGGGVGERGQDGEAVGGEGAKERGRKGKVRGDFTDGGDGEPGWGWGGGKGGGVVAK